MFDEANLRATLAKWLPEPFELRTAVHLLGHATLAVVNALPRPDGFCIFRDDGKYFDGTAERTVFRRGEVFARHGTVNERWRQADVGRIRQNLVAHEKDRWREELRAELVELGIARDAEQLITGPAANFTWRLDRATFDAATLELFRRDDDIPIQRLLNEAAADAAPLIDADDFDSMLTCPQTPLSGTTPLSRLPPCCLPRARRSTGPHADLARPIAQPVMVASGGCSSTRGRYSTSWMLPSKVRLSIISRATSG